MSDYRWLTLAGACLTLMSGCVERRFVIESTPPGAKVYVNNRAVGYTPVDVPFTYYGKYLIQLELDGHQTLIKEQDVSAPWYEFPPFDFFAENLYPFKIDDVQRLHYDMAPLQRPNLDELRQQAEDLRQKGRALPEPTIPAPGANDRRPTNAPPPAPGPTPIVTRSPVGEPTR
jgi:hypothetical protein